MPGRRTVPLDTRQMTDALSAENRETLERALNKLEVLVKQNHDRASRFTPHLWAADQKMIADARRALMNACRSEGGGWRDISTAPRDGTDILAWQPDGGFAVLCWSDFGSGHWNCQGADGYEWETYVTRPTHWQPIQAVPVP